MWSQSPEKARCSSIFPSRSALDGRKIHSVRARRGRKVGKTSCLAKSLSRHLRPLPEVRKEDHQAAAGPDFRAKAADFVKNRALSKAFGSDMSLGRAIGQSFGSMTMGSMCSGVGQ